MITQELHKQVQSIVSSCLSKASSTYNKQIPIPIIDYSLRGTTAGQAIKKNNQTKIKLNPILMLENLDTFQQTVIHECAHIICYEVYPRCQPHGYEWQRVMRLLGVDPDRCHQYDVTNARVRQADRHHKYTCGCSEPHMVTDIIHNRMRGGQRRFCRTCKQYLVYANGPTPIASPIVHSPIVTPVTPGVTNKRAEAERLYRNSPDKSRGYIIKLFMQKLNMTQAGASTYHYNCKQKFGD